MTDSKAVSGELSAYSIGKAGLFVAAAVASLTVALGLYLWIGARQIAPSPVPSTYKWLLLQEVPGPRLIIESGSNSHHGLDTDAIAEALDITAINIADNGGYDIEQKVARLARHTRDGDVVVLPLEWSYYTRDTLTDDFLKNLPDMNRDYFNAVGLIDRARLLLSTPPASVLGFSRLDAPGADPAALTPVQSLYVAALTQPSGHTAFETARAPAPGVVGQSCDQYLFPERELKVSKKFKRALGRLKQLQKRGVKVMFAWPAMAGDGCMTAGAPVQDFAEQIEAEVTGAGFEFVGRPMQNVYPSEYMDDTPYHLIRAGAEIHTGRFVDLLRIHGVRPAGARRDVSAFARTRLYELERQTAELRALVPLPLDEVVRVEDSLALSNLDFAAGWWSHEPYGRWMRDNEAVLRLNLPDTPDARLRLSGSAAGGGTQNVQILYDGSVIGEGAFGDGQPVIVDLEGVPRGKTAEFFIRLPDAGPALSPADRGMGGDRRTLTLHLQELALTTADDVPPAPVAKLAQQAAPPSAPEIPAPADTVIPVATPMPVAPPLMATPAAYDGALSLVGQRGLCAQPLMPTSEARLVPLKEAVFLGAAGPDRQIEFGEGWWPREPGGRWMGCCEARFTIRLPDSRPRDAVLQLSGDVFGGGSANLEIVLNDKVRVEATYSRGQPVRVPLAGVAGDDLVEVVLRFPGRDFESPAALGLGEDPRILSGFFEWVEITGA